MLKIWRRISGTLPHTFPVALRKLEVHKNLISGSIPSRLPNVESCQLIQVSLPGSMGRLLQQPMVAVPPPSIAPLNVMSIKKAHSNFFLCPLPADLPSACRPNSLRPSKGTHCQGQAYQVSPGPPFFTRPPPAPNSPPPPSPHPPPPIRRQSHPSQMRPPPPSAPPPRWSTHPSSNSDNLQASACPYSIV